MLSKADIKYINSLQNKKYRKIEHAFVVEGLKNVLELLKSSYEIERLFCVPAFQYQLEPLLNDGLKIEVVTESELQKVGILDNNQSALAVVKVRDEVLPADLFAQRLVLALDTINDPGNLGTIIRLADWYGLPHIICSSETVDFYNPKVINASKGSFTRVSAHYLSLEDFLSHHQHVPIWAACMEGSPIYQLPIPEACILILGNEANGIRPEIQAFSAQSITIPRRGEAESLNVGVAAGILIDRFLGH